MDTSTEHVSCLTVPIVADDKDWTWVLERPCPECGLDPAGIPRGHIADMVRAVGPLWSDALRRPDVRTRPDDSTWSVLEYACHVRDVCRLFDERLVLMLEQDDPVFANWDQDETARTMAYADQEPDTVATELTDAAERAADSFAGVAEGQWSRPGRRSNGSAFTVESLGRYLVHDLVHHAHDIGAA